MSKLDEVLNLAKTKGYFWPAYDVYGGSSGFYVLGPYGVILTDGITSLWRQLFVRPMGFLEIDAPSVTPYKVLKSSGHVDNFKDPMAECSNCHNKYRADNLLSEAGKEVSESASPEVMQLALNDAHIRCPNCGFTNWVVKPFMTMFSTNIGPYENSEGFLRPETAQGIFVEFQRLLSLNRGKLPMGVSQAGRGFRNEISPRQSIIRLREFHMLEVELFIDPAAKVSVIHPSEKRLPILHEAILSAGRAEPDHLTLVEALDKGIVKNEWLGMFMQLSLELLCNLGVPVERQRFREKLKGERAHYSAQTFDHEVFIEEVGWLEVAGHAYRTDYDLKSHMKGSGQDMTVSVDLESPISVPKKKVNFRIDALKLRYPESWQGILAGGYRLDENGVLFNGTPIDRDVYTINETVEVVKVRKIIPHVVEPSFGLERLMLACMYFAYQKKDDRIVLSVPGGVIKRVAAVFPLLSKPELTLRAQEVRERLLKAGIDVIYDDSGSIGRRYARVDEAGVPIAITIDHQSLEDGTVTVRNRDTWEQVRKPEDQLVSFMESLSLY
ncbi:MAG: glycine--tRNA ligase [Nitrososphaerota archaeon]|nr:glycine--tRNA ligase [Nitrososphaerota archaeon]